MTKKTVIPAFFEGPPPLFKTVIAEEKVVQPYVPLSRRSPRSKLHISEK